MRDIKVIYGITVCVAASFFAGFFVAFSFHPNDTNAQSTCSVDQPTLENIYDAIFHRPLDQGALGYVGYDVDFVLDELRVSQEHTIYTGLFSAAKALENRHRESDTVSAADFEIYKDYLDSALSVVSEWAKTIPSQSRTDAAVGPTQARDALQAAYLSMNTTAQQAAQRGLFQAQEIIGQPINLSLPSGFSTTTTPPPPPASTTPSFEITVESGIRLQDAGVSFVIKLSDGRYRMYYCGGGIVSAISSDGLSFTKETGTRLAAVGPLGNDESVVCDPSVIQLTDGRFRMYYKGGTSGSGPGQSVQKIYSAISSDGLTFQREGLAIDSTQQDDSFASVPEAIRLSNGSTRVYFVSDGAYVGHGIVSATSSDGLTFTRDTTKVVAFVDPAITTLPDGRFLLVAPTIPVLPGGVTASVPPGIYALVSQDGVTFGSPITILADSSIWIDPTVVQITADTYRVYYWNPNDQPSKVYSLTMRLK